MSDGADVPPGRPLFAAPQTHTELRPDDSIVLSSRIGLGSYPPSMAHVFRAAAAAVPGQVLAAQRSGGGWQTVTYGAARRRVDSIAQWLLGHCRAGRTVMVLSGNSIEHLLVTFACYTAGIPVVPVSTAHSLLSRDHTKLRAMAELAGPAVVFADDGDAYAAALGVVAAAAGAAVVTVSGGPAGLAVTPFAELEATQPATAVDDTVAGLGPGTTAKILFTSGSTAHPKGVVNTHRMMVSNMAMMDLAWPFVRHEPPVLLDWLPWSHTFGGNHNVNLVVTHRGTFYIDDGRPTPDLLHRTLRNMHEVSPTLAFNVPAGYALLVPVLERDRELAAKFFARLRFVFFAGSALPQQLWDRIEKLGSSLGRPVPMTTAWGATETAPAATAANYHSGRSDCIGLPLPGVQVKLAPAGDKREIRVKGPNVTPGYYKDPGLTARAFDAEGFYRTGDAVQLIDPGDPGRGLRFDGRIAEDFKLLTGTWVSTGTLRPSLLGAAGGLIADAVLTGQDREYAGALVWLHLDHARRACGLPTGAPPHAAPAAGGPSAAADAAALAAHERVRRRLHDALDTLNRDAGGSSHIVRRVLVLVEPPSLDAGEITDKGYVNQRAVLDRRAAQVAELYRDPPPPQVVCWPG